MDKGLLDTYKQPLGSSSVSVGTAGATVTFTSAQDIAAPFVGVSNASAVLAYMSIGGTATVAVSTVGLNCVPIPTSSTLNFYKGPGVSTLNFITSASTATILVTAQK